MITRQREGPLEPLNLEIEATARRNRGRNRREQLRRRIEFEEMRRIILLIPKSREGLMGKKMKRWNGEFKRGVSTRCKMSKEDTFNLHMFKGVEDLNKEGKIKGPIGMHKILEGITNNPSNLEMERGANNRAAQIEESGVVRKLLERVDMLESAKVASFQQSLPPLMEDPNQYMSPMPQTMEEVNFMGRQGYQGQQGNFGQARQYQPQGTYQAQGQSYNQGQFPQGQGRFQNTPQQFPGGGTSYNPNARKHENFSYSNPKAAVQYPPGFDPGAKPPNNEGRPSTDEMLSLIYKEMKEKDAKVDEYMKSNNNQMKNMEFQIGQLATTVGNMQNKGKFPSTTELNPKEHCKAIELRSGTKYQGPSLPSEDVVEEKTTEIEQEAEEDKVSEKEEGEEIAPLSEDEEEKGKMKRDKEEMKKKLEKDESSQPVPKWKRVRD
ncbi:hypothetical protein ACS0TY_017020 [Phlomoides rotata]